MYSWKTIRIACGILLVLPIVHLTYVMSRSTMETLDASPGAWVREMNAYAEQDAKGALPAHPILVVGGQRAKLWRGLEDVLAPRPVLMRGLGDAIVEDIHFNHSRLIGYYQPDTLVLVPSNSEFFIRDNKSAEELTRAIRKLAKLDGSYGVTRRFYIFTPLKTPVRPQDYARIDKTTTLLNDWAAKDDRVEILDANALLGGPDNKPRAYYFRGDGINLNEHGYLRLSLLLLDQIEADEASNQVNTTAP